MSSNTIFRKEKYDNSPSHSTAVDCCSPYYELQSHFTYSAKKTENTTSNHQGADSYRTVYLPSVEFVLYKLLTDSHEIKITDVLCSYSKLPEVPRRKQVLSK